MSTSRGGTRMFGGLWAAMRAATRPGSPGMVVRLRAMPRLITATVTGRYHGTSVWRLVGIVAAALYVISPVDLVPEGLLGIFGLADDAMVLSWLAVAVVNETEDFLSWEADPLRRAPTGEAGPGSSTGHPGAARTVRGSVVD